MERWRDNTEIYCSTGRCFNCAWCDFLKTFTPERVLQLLEAANG